MCSCSQISSDNKPYTSDKHWKAKKHKVKNRKIGKINCNWPRQVLDKKDNTNKFLYYTVTKGYHYAYPDWECEKGRYSTQVIHLKNKTKNCNHNLYGNKKKAREGKKKQKKCNKLTRVNAKNMKGDSNVKHKRNMITQHQPREKKKKLVLVNHHVPQTPPHVYQINLVILLSRQPHTTEIKKKRQQNMETLFVKQHSLAGHLIEAKQKRNTLKGETHLPRVVCCKRSVFFSSVSLSVLNSTWTHTTPPLWLCQTRHWKRNKTFMTPLELHTSRQFLSLFSGRSQDILLERNEKKKRRHRRQLQLTLVCRRSHFALFLNIVFTRTDNEKSHPEVIPGNKELRRKLFFLHTRYARSPKDNTDQ